MRVLGLCLGGDKQHDISAARVCSGRIFLIFLRKDMYSKDDAQKASKIIEARGLGVWMTKSLSN